MRFNLSRTSSIALSSLWLSSIIFSDVSSS
uniref:Uncharacterized protein n=1 Tax=Musa acuminata subsp. malaccensis TaxID=214687 RepID=A0A804KWB5_MUSAM